MVKVVLHTVVVHRSFVGLWYDFPVSNFNVQGNST
jgi:hypothetical protein